MELRKENNELVIRAERLEHHVCAYQINGDIVCGVIADYATYFTDDQPRPIYICTEHLDALIDETEDKEIAEAEDPIVSVVIRHEKWNEFALFCRYHCPKIHWLYAYTSASVRRYGMLVSISREYLEEVSQFQFGL